MSDTLNIDFLKKELDEFVASRNWQQFHKIKNLLMNLVGESSELLEIYTWINEQEADTLHHDPKKREHIQEEIGDVLMTLIMIASELDINLSQALKDKIKKTKIKYPVPESS